MLGHEALGAGPLAVVVLNDWMCDTSTWEPARPYLDRDAFTWVFADLRGYGRSREQTGAFDLHEIARDVLALADAKGFTRFALVGHSMSCLPAIHLAQREARLESLVLVTPPPPRGFGGGLEGAQKLARGADATRLAALTARFGERLAPGFARFKMERWRARSEPEAVASYAAMFATAGIPEPERRIAIPTLAIAGEHDVPPMQPGAARGSLAPLCDALTVEAIDAGHYPMQESPPRFVALVQRFLRLGRGASAG